MKKILIILVLVVILGVAGFLAWPSLLSVKSPTYKISDASCVRESDLESSLHLDGQKIVLINPASVQSRLMKNFPCIKKVSVDKTFPDKVTVTVEGRTPLAVIDFVSEPTSDNLPVLADNVLEATSSSQSAVVLKDPEENISTASSSGKFLVDKDGVAFSTQTDGAGLPEFVYSGSSLKVGQSIDGESLNKSLAIVSQLKVWSIFNSTPPVIFGNSLHFSSNSDGVISFALDKDLKTELASLQLILRTVTMNSGSKNGNENSPVFKSIDLRFNKPVIVYEK